VFQSPHHGSPPTRIASKQWNHCSLKSPKIFATKSLDQKTFSLEGALAVDSSQPENASRKTERASMIKLIKWLDVPIGKWPKEMSIDYPPEFDGLQGMGVQQPTITKLIKLGQELRKYLKI